MITLYSRGQQYMDAGKWRQVLECFEEVKRLEPGYQKTEALLWRVRQELDPSPSVEVTDLSGQEVSQARSTLANNRLELGAYDRLSSETKPEGQIIEQRPVAGTEVAAG